MSGSLQPRRLSDFDVVSELGAGSYSRVLLLRRKCDGQEFAVKVSNKTFLLRHNKAEGARREREVLESLLGARGVVRLRFTFQDVDNIYLATDVCAGGDLQQQLARRPGGQATRAEARFWGAQLALALDAVHAIGAVHRDVKPENVLLTADGHVRLCDFGSVKRPGVDGALVSKPGVSEPATMMRSRCGTFAGTPEYCAPELIEGKLVSCAADYWSLGCVMFHMLAGRPPFKGASEYLTYQLVLSRNFEYPARPANGEDNDASCGFDDDSQDCCDALLAMDPCQRLATLARVKAQLFFRDVSWDSLWDSPAVRIIPPPSSSENQASELPDEELALPRPPATQRVPWRLGPGESVLMSGSARRKRGAHLVEGTLVLTTCMRLALLPPGQGSVSALLMSSGAALARLRRMDQTHLVVRADTGEDAFVELTDSVADAWVNQVATLLVDEGSAAGINSASTYARDKTII